MSAKGFLTYWLLFSEMLVPLSQVSIFGITTVMLLQSTTAQLRLLWVGQSKQKDEIGHSKQNDEWFVSQVGGP